MSRLWRLALLLCLLGGDDTWATWKFSPKSRRHAHKYQNDAQNYGPNVCAVQEVFKTGEKFYPDCVKKRLKKVCGNPTFVRYECCCGYDSVDGQEGCPSVAPLKNIYDTIVDMELKQFPKLLTNTELEYNLKEEGAYTVFVPIDSAFDDLSHDLKSRLYPWTYNALSLLHYHVVRGWHHTDNMKKLQMLPTNYYGLKPLWINRSSKQEMPTINCARMLRGNILATNGVIHLIEKLLSPFDSFGNITDVMFRDAGQFSQFVQVLYTSQLIQTIRDEGPFTIFAPNNYAFSRLPEMLFGNITDVMFRDAGQFSQFVQVLYTSQLIQTIRDEGPFTIFAPNNYAFSRLPKMLLMDVLRDAEIAAALVLHHTAKGVYCASSNIDKNGVKMIDGTTMRFQCKKKGHYIHNSRIVKPDIPAGNGMIHLINKVQLPPLIQTVESLARELQLNKFLQLCYDAGLLDKLITGSEMTVFIPTDDAFNKLHKDVKTSLFEDPSLFESIFNYLTAIGKTKTDFLVGDKGFKTNSGNLMKITVHREGILMDDAAIVQPNMECYNGIIHVIDRVLVPPHRTLHQIIDEAEDLSIFRKGLEYSKVENMLMLDGLTFTVFAPTDQAFNKLETWQFDAMFDTEEIVEKHMLHHIVNRLIVGRAISRNSLIHLKSLQGESLVFTRSAKDKFAIDTFSDILEPTVIASNGILYRIDRVLECKCDSEPG